MLIAYAQRDGRRKQIVTNIPVQGTMVCLSPVLADDTADSEIVASETAAGVMVVDMIEVSQGSLL